jgi:putative transposase
VRQQLGSETAWGGGRLIVADPFLPSPKMCSARRTVSATPSPAKRISGSEGCGPVIDQDANAARTLLMPAVRGREAGGAEGSPSPLGRRR